MSRKIYIALLIILFFFKNPTQGQSYFTRQYGFTNESAWAITPTLDSGYYLASAVNVGHIIKTDKNGSPIWDRYINHDSSSVPIAITETSDSGVVILFSSGYSVNHTCILKLDKDGVLVWSKQLDNTAFRGSNVVSTSDNKVVMVANNYSPDQMLLIKFDNNGDTLWTKIYKDLYGFKIIANNDNSYSLFASYTHPPIYSALAVMELDSMGNATATKIFTDADQSMSLNMCTFERTGDNGYIINGTENPDLQGRKYPFLIKLGENLDIEWSKRYLTNDSLSGLKSLNLVSLSNKNYANIFLSFTAPYALYTFIIKTDSSGDVEKSEVMEYGLSTYAQCKSGDGGFACFTSLHGYGIYLIKFDSSADNCASVPYQVTVGQIQVLSNTISVQNDAVTISFSSITPLFNQSVSSFYICTSAINEADKPSESDIQLYPNPTAGPVNILIKKPFTVCRLRLFDMAGRVIFAGTLDGASHNFDFGINKGMYVAEISCDKEIWREKLIVN